MDSEKRDVTALPLGVSIADRLALHIAEYESLLRVAEAARDHFADPSESSEQRVLSALSQYEEHRT